jgi:hypothetical protein
MSHYIPLIISHEISPFTRSFIDIHIKMLQSRLTRRSLRTLREVRPSAHQMTWLKSAQYVLAQLLGAMLAGPWAHGPTEVCFGFLDGPQG